MILLRSRKPVPGKDDVWESEIRVRNLTPERRVKLLALLKVSRFVLRDDNTDMQVGEIRRLDLLRLR